MSKKGIEYKASLSVNQVAEYLESLKSSLLEGKVCLQVADEHVTLNLDLGQALSLEISGDQKKSRNKIGLELSWFTVVPTVDDSPGMVISSNEPPEPEPEAGDQPETPAEEPAPEPVADAEAPAEPEKKAPDHKTTASKAKSAAAPKKAPAKKTAAKAKPGSKTAAKKAS